MNVDEDLLKKNIQDSLDQISVDSESQAGGSIAQKILKNLEEGLQIKKIHDKAIEAIDALSLPGGEHVHPKYYGGSTEGAGYVSLDGRRTILELSLIEQITSNPHLFVNNHLKGVHRPP